VSFSAITLCVASQQLFVVVVVVVVYFVIDSVQKRLDTLSYIQQRARESSAKGHEVHVNRIVLCC
jgi:hypothetical protein